MKCSGLVSQQSLKPRHNGRVTRTLKRYLDYFGETFQVISTESELDSTSYNEAKNDIDVWDRNHIQTKNGSKNIKSIPAISQDPCENKPKPKIRLLHLCSVINIHLSL